MKKYNEIFTENVNTYNSFDALKIVDNSPVGIITFNDELTIQYCNEYLIKLGRFYNIPFDSLIGSNLLQIELLEGINIKEDLLDLQAGYSFEKEFKKLEIPGGDISILLKGSPLMLNGVFEGGVLVFEDIKPTILPGNDEIIKSEYFEKIINKVNDLLFITDPEGRVKFSYGKKLKNLNEEIIKDFPINKIFSASAQHEFVNFMDSVRLKRRSEKFNLEILIGTDKRIYECRVEPLLNKRGQVHYIFFFLNDVSDLLRSNEELSNQLNELQHFKVITESISDSVIVTDVDGKILFCNKASEKLFHTAKEYLYGHFVGKALNVFDENYFLTIKGELSKTNSWKINLTIFRDANEKDIIEAKFSMMESKGLIVIIFNNITEKVTLEHNYIESEERLKNIAFNTDDLICNVESDGIITYVNKKFIDVLGYLEEELYGKQFTDFIDIKYFENYNFDLREFKGNPNKKIELPLVTKSGAVNHFISKFKPVFFENKIVKYYNGFLYDVSSIKRAEKDLEMFRALFDGSQDGIAVQSGGKLLMVNDSFTSIFGYSKKEEMINKDLLDIVSNNDSIKVSEYFQMLERKKDVPGRFEFLGKKKDNTAFFAEVTSGNFEIDNQQYVVIITRDITERKRAQQSIRESEEKYRNITENIDDCLFSYEENRGGLKPVFYTSSVEKITGYTPTDFLMDSRLQLKLIYPDDFTEVKKKLKRILSNRIQISEEIEFRIINKLGNIVWIRTRINILRSAGRGISKIFGLVSDITLHKKAQEELNKSTENLIKLNDTKDKFISIISHDLRTPFSSILGFTDLLLEDESLNQSERRQYIKYIQESSKSMLGLVNSLLDWTRLQTGRIKFEPEKTKIQEVISDSVNALSGAAFQKDIKIYSEIDHGVSVFIDKNLISQVFNNLLSNAIKFTNNGGKIRISSRSTDKIRFHEFFIADNGVGIAEENIHNLFRVDTKYTSEGTSGEKGSGLGLSLVKEIIEKHGGTIWVKSTLNKGSEFHFTLPIASATILLVDDNKTDRLLYSKILKGITPDYNVEIASNGKEALDRIIASPPALVITDHFMPEMTGYELVRELKKSFFKGKAPVIILSGDIDKNLIADYNELGIENVFKKPVDLSHFKNAVEKALRSGLIS